MPNQVVLNLTFVLDALWLLPSLALDIPHIVVVLLVLAIQHLLDKIGLPVTFLLHLNDKGLDKFYPRTLPQPLVMSGRKVILGLVESFVELLSIFLRNVLRAEEGPVVISALPIIVVFLFCSVRR